MEEFKLSEIEIYLENETNVENQINFVLDQIQKLDLIELQRNLVYPRLL